MEMSSFTKNYQYILDRYTQSLTKYDAMALVERSKARAGSLLAAVKEADITRKTVYDWENNSDDVKTSTKRKILQASLEADYYKTLEFLIRKAALNYNEILERYINAITDKVYKISDPEEFQMEVAVFQKYLERHSGAISDLKNVYMNKVIETINAKAMKLGVNGISGGITLVNSRILSRKIMHLIEIISLKTMRKEEIAERLRLPSDFVEKACKTARYINPVGNVMGDFEEQLNKNKLHPQVLRDIGLPSPTGYALRARKY